MEQFMASLKDRSGYGDSSQRSRDIEFLPLVADVIGWFGLIICAAGFLFLLGQSLTAVFGHYETPPSATLDP
jgi:hypothetical protein